MGASYEARGAQSTDGKGSMKSRIAALLTILAVAVGAGGTFAIAGSGVSDAGSAAKSQYKPNKCDKDKKKPPPPDCP